jgi:hypothetical protein
VNKERIVKAITVMATAWGIVMDGPRMKIYRDALIDLPPGAVEKGVAHLIKTRPFAGNIPVVAEIREAAEEFLADEHFMLEGPGKEKIFITQDNCHLFADKNCPKCLGTGKFPQDVPKWGKDAGMMRVVVRCECVQEPE